MPREHLDLVTWTFAIRPLRTRCGFSPGERLRTGATSAIHRAGEMERMTGIEPAFSAWEADVLPLNYIREDLRL